MVGSAARIRSVHQTSFGSAGFYCQTKSSNMPKRKVYHITQNAEGMWQGKVEGAERASVTGPTKAEVQQKTIDMAKNHGHASVIIHGKDGKIQEERTYGDDPRATKG